MSDNKIGTGCNFLKVFMKKGAIARIALFIALVGVNAYADPIEFVVNWDCGGDGCDAAENSAKDALQFAADTWGSILPSFYEGEQMITDTGILYVKDAISEGYIEDNINSPISGIVWANLSGSIDMNTMLGSFNGKWSIINDGGTFEGSVVGIVTVAYVSGRFIGKGTRDFSCQKIKCTFQGTINNYIIDLTITGELSLKSE